MSYIQIPTKRFTFVDLRKSRSTIYMNYNTILRGSLVAACIVGISGYLSQKSHPYLAGLLIAIPVALPSLWFIEHKNSKDLKEYVKGFAIGIAIYFAIALFFYYSVVKTDISKKNAIIYSMMLWITLVTMCYILIK